MTEYLQSLTDAFAEDYLQVKTLFFTDKTTFPQLAAYMHAFRGLPVNLGLLKTCVKMVKDASKSFDDLSDELTPFLSAAICFAEDPFLKLHDIALAYNALKSVYSPSPFLIIAATVISNSGFDSTDYDLIAKRTKTLYDKMQDNHPFVTGYDDLCVCAIYVLSQKEDNSAINEMEKCTATLKEKFFFKNSMQSLTHVLAFYKHPEAACERTEAIFKALKEEKVNLGTSWHIAALGALAISNADPLIIATHVKEVSDILKGKEGFSFLAVPSKDRYMYAAFIVALYYLKSEKENIPSHVFAHKTAVMSVAAANTTDDLKGIINFKKS